LVDGLFLIIPYDLALGLGRSVGYLAYILLPKYRRLTKKHLRMAFGDSKTEDEISRVAKAVFMNLGMGLAEVLSLPKIKNRLGRLIDLEGLEKIDRVLKEGKGAVVISGHFGNWELLPMYFASKGYPSNVIARPVYYEKYNEWIQYLRNNMGVNVILRTDSPKKMLELLKRNELVGILPDQDIDSIDGIYIDFLGRKAYTPVAPVKIALASGAPIIPAFIVRKNKQHSIIIEEPIKIEDKVDKEEAILLYTQKWSDIIESYVRKYPEQWVWMHKRWKTQPAGV
jgi:KDO2-lipid IV(A) lauroyltransferase